MIWYGTLQFNLFTYVNAAIRNILVRTYLLSDDGKVVSIDYSNTVHTVPTIAVRYLLR